jgi:hypothetical protein
MILSQELFSQYFQKPIIVAYFMKPDVEDTKKYLMLNFQKKKRKRFFSSMKIERALLSIFTLKPLDYMRIFIRYGVLNLLKSTADPRNDFEFIA